jgi:hypothetical protein
MYSVFVLLYGVGLLITPLALNVIYSSASLFGCLGTPVWPDGGVFSYASSLLGESPVEA